MNAPQRTVLGVGLVVVAAILTCCLATAALAQTERDAARQTLRGLTGVQVVVGGIPMTVVNAAGTTEFTSDLVASLRAGIDSLLRIDGIRVLSDSERLEDPTLPRLRVRLEYFSPGRGSLLGLVVFFAQVCLEQNVTVPRFTLPTVAATWCSGGSIGYHNEDDARFFAVVALRQVAEFTRTYRAANPRD